MFNIFQEVPAVTQRLREKIRNNSKGRDQLVNHLKMAMQTGGEAAAIEQVLWPLFVQVLIYTHWDQGVQVFMFKYGCFQSPVDIFPRYDDRRNVHTVAGCTHATTEFHSVLT